jgi:hypothetical protein
MSRRQQIHMSEKYQILFYWLPLYYYLYVICTIFLYQYSIRVDKLPPVMAELDEHLSTVELDGH